MGLGGNRWRGRWRGGWWGRMVMKTPLNHEIGGRRGKAPLDPEVGGGEEGGGVEDPVNCVTSH